MSPPEFRRRPAPRLRDEPTASPNPLPGAHPAPRLRDEPNPPPGPYPSPPPREEPTADEVAAARRAYDSHVPSMFARQCLAPGCGEWPCRPYREAVAVLRAAGVILWA